MKKKIVNAFLMMALIASSMGTFVSCKDYDEDAYVDLRNRISNEASLRQTLEGQVKSLEQALAALEALEKSHYDELKLKFNDYLTKQEAANTYVTIKTFNEYVTNNDAKIVLINEAIEQLKKDIADIKKDMEDMVTKDELKTNVAALEAKIQKANEAASEALGKATEAAKLAQENSDKIKALEEEIGKWKKDSSEQFNPSSIWEAIDLLREAIKGWPEEIERINLRVDSIVGALEGYELRINLLEQNFDSLSQVVSLHSEQILELQKQIVQIQEEWNTKIQITLKQAIDASDEAKKIANEALKKSNEALLAAEAANAKASNAEQLALNAFYMAQEACEIAKKTAADLEDAIKRAEAAAEKAEAAAKKAEEKADAADKAKKAAEDAEAKCDSILNEVKKYASSGCACPKDLEERLKKAQETADEAKKKAETAQEAADAAKKIAETAKELAEAADKKADEAKKTADEAKNTADKAAEDIEKLKKEDAAIWEKIKEIEGKLCDGTCGVDKEKVEKIVNEYIENNTVVKEIKEKITEIENNITNLETSLKNLKTDFANMITGVIIQATENPVLGYLNLPVDARSTLLMAYAGSADAAFTFPSQNGKWIRDNQAFTDEDVYIMTNGGKLTSVPGWFQQTGGQWFANDGSSDYAELYMGRVFMTVNPNTVDFSGQTFTLENSRGEQSPVVLKPARKSNDLLTFGYDRTRAENGFYDAEAYVKMTPENMKELTLAIDIEGLKSDVKAAWKSKSKTDLFTLLSDIYKRIDNKYAANALKASWTDTDGKEHSIYSNYAIGTAIARPLSFNTLIDIQKLQKLPGEKQIYNIIDELISKIKVDVPEMDITKGIEFGKVEAEGQKVTASVTGYVNGNPQTVTVTVYTSQENVTTLDQLVELVAENDKQTWEVSVDLAKLFNEFNNLDTEWRQAIEDTKQNMINELQDFVRGKYNTLNSYIHLYTLFNINMVAHQPGKGFTFIGQTVNRATKIGSDAYLFPTSNTAEYFAPAYRKYVAISNVYDASTKAALSPDEAAAKAQAATGDNCNKVISGDTTVKINGEAGYIYEVSYAAVDYHGMMTRRTFYIMF